MKNTSKKVSIPESSSDYIFVPNKLKAKLEQEKEAATYYTLKGEKGGKLDKNGNTTIAADSPAMYAKIVDQNGRPTYWIKSDTTGFLNPVDMYANKSKLQKDAPGQQKNKFIQVNKAAFNMYLLFLQTKNEVHLKNAIKENF